MAVCLCGACQAHALKQSGWFLNTLHHACTQARRVNLRPRLALAGLPVPWCGPRHRRRRQGAACSAPAAGSHGVGQHAVGGTAAALPAHANAGAKLKLRLASMKAAPRPEIHPMPAVVERSFYVGRNVVEELFVFRGACHVCTLVAALSFCVRCRGLLAECRLGWCGSSLTKHQRVCVRVDF
jgi:hypothetical protein